ncbi:MarR family transcriptional regulator [Novosphingobium sp. fls2-241-R2A-195]|uniref:MarR family transcriptional regulator n=1 Tax=Novosphingobium sp. fls2-241-R2A-195 TaxID=3040296 RepID=UPI00255165DF|nr:MarR family transcriptional regulator [Novosphingobium sp. fls2-241-R2A-195]
MREADYLQPDFAYGGPEKSASGGPGVALSIYANRAHLRATLREDADAAGMRIVAAAPLADLVTMGEGLAQARLADVVLVDCPQVDAGVLAALARLDLRAAGGATRLIVSTGVEALDDVFACMDQSSPVLLVDPDRAERVLALGRVLATMPSGRVRELSEDDRLMLLRLTEQVGQIAGRIDRLDAGGIPAPLPAVPAAGFSPGQLPDARLVRRIIRQRQLRARFLDNDLFADPAWDMLLDLTASRLEGKRVSVTSLCIASGVPPTTALRWIGQMVDAGLFVRLSDGADKRRAFIDLSEKAMQAMARYFTEIALTAPAPI